VREGWILDEGLQDVAYLSNVSREQQGHLAAAEIIGECGEHAGSGHVDERDGLGIEYDGSLTSPPCSFWAPALMGSRAGRGQGSRGPTGRATAPPRGVS